MIRRNKQVDTAKGILMTMVILGHVLLASSNLDGTCSFLLKLIYSFHMSAFLIISGILFDCDKQKENTISAFLSTRVKRILVPYFLFELLGAITQNVFSYGERETVLAVIKRILTFQMYVGADWYLLTYFLAVILVFLMNKIKASKTVLPVSAAVVFVIVSIFQYAGISDQYVFILRILLAYTLLIAGIQLKTGLLSYWWGKTCAAVIGFVISLLVNSSVFLHAAILGNPVLFLLGSICGTYVILQISYHVNNRLINIIGRYSIISMGIHQDIIWIFGWFFGLSGKWNVLVPNFTVTYLTAIAVTIIYRSIVERKQYESVYKKRGSSFPQ